MLSMGSISFPWFRVSADDPFERGRQLGAASAPYVRRSIQVYREIFEHYAGLGWPEVRSIAAGFLPPIARYDGAIAREMEGLAAGASVALEDIAAINSRTELMFGFSPLPPPECTSFYIGPSATSDGHGLLGQNWDWNSRAADTTILVEVDQGDRPSFIMLAEAGLIGKIGFNSAGLGIATNALISDLDRGGPGVPFHVILRAVLNSGTLAEAVEAVTGADRAASGNYLIATAAGEAVNIETAPGGAETAFQDEPTSGFLARSNHFQCAVPFRDSSLGNWHDSPVRAETLLRLLDAHRGQVNRDSVPELLSDHTGFPDSICRHPNPEQPVVEQSSTIASWVIDLSKRAASLSSGPPCEVSYVDIVPRFASSVRALSRHCG
jgi:isopenicillin-N N-acyltransferase like protein